VSWSADPELQEMFLEEIEERVARLIEGGQAMQRGEVDAELSGTMLREGHTIKGTSRVMGYEAISRAGWLIEQLWRGIQHGDIDPYPNLGRAIEALANTLPAAAKADPDTGTPELVEAIAQLNRVSGVGDDDPTPPAPPSPPEPSTRSNPPPPTPSGPPPAPEGSAGGASGPSDDVGVSEDASEDAAAEDGGEGATVVPLPGAFEAVRAPEMPIGVDREAAPAAASADGSGIEIDLDTADAEDWATSATVTGPDLGGLLGALESWATGQTMMVSAGRLYRLINYVAGVRIELQALAKRLGAATVDDVTEEYVGGVRRDIETIADTAVELEADALGLAAVPVKEMTNTLPQLVRYLSKKLGKEVRFEVVGDEDLALDRQVLDIVADPIRQLIVNAVYHGVEMPADREALGKPATALVSLTMAIKNHKLEIVVRDDGGGINWPAVRLAAVEQGYYDTSDPSDPEKLQPILFFPGFSTAPDSELGSIGSGLSNVAEAVESLYGRIRLESSDTGTTVTIVVPTTRDLQRVLIVDAGNMKWGIPEAAIDEVVPVADAKVTTGGGGRRSLIIDDQEHRVVSLADLVGATDPRPETKFVRLSHRIGCAAVGVQRVLGVREVAAKELGPLLAGPSHITGAALLGGGDVVLLLDAGSLVQRSQDVPQPLTPGARVLVVDDSQGARAVVSGALASSGFTTSVAGSAAEALEVLAEQEVDALVVDFSMPNEDGVDLVHQVREKYEGLPIIMLSGVATPEDQERAVAAGVDAFFNKADFREGALADALRATIESAAAQKGAAVGS
jgi:chemotaxis protein histidine kinase CheA/methylmalonyl-CoA mutase cobalamin-binding subunit